MAYYRDGLWNVYLLVEDGAQETGPCKIGTATNVEYRLTGLKGGNWRDLVLVRVWQTETRDEAHRVERTVLQQLKRHRFPGRDWLNCAPATVASTVEQLLKVDA